MFSMKDLENINEELKPLQDLADRETKSIYGLTGLLYTPHIDAYNLVAIKKAKILRYLKKAELLPLSEVEVISTQLMVLFRKAKSRDIVEYQGHNYQCMFAPLTLSKTGKIVRKWVKYWLKILPNGEVDTCWKAQVKETWPENFVIRKSDYE